MTPSSRRAILEAVMIGDVCIGLAGLIVSYDISSHRPLLHLLHTVNVDHPIQRLISLLVLSLMWHISFTGIGLYRSHRISGLIPELWDVAKASLAATLCVLVWCWFRPRSATQPLQWDVMIAGAFGFVTFIMLALTRCIGRYTVYRMRSHHRNLRNVLVVGTNNRAIAFANDIKQHSHWGYQLVGFVDELWYSQDASEEYRQKLLGAIDNIPNLLRTLALDEVVIALPMASFYAQAAWIVSLCRQQGIVVRFTGTIFELPSDARSGVSAGVNHFLPSSDDVWNPASSFIKRLVDLGLSACMLLLSSPLMLVIAIVIKATSHGPVFFLQQRLGIGKRKFTIIKFRTMQSDAESMIHTLHHLNESEGPTFKLRNDPRITPVGRFLRKTSLDELPQLFNVFIGDMSLVGPRPLPLRDYEGFSHDWQRRRFSVKPGITCLWQVQGRSMIGFEQWMELDVDYINRWSVWLDIKILLQTIPAVLRGSGAV